MGRLRTSLIAAATAGALVTLSLAAAPDADAATRKVVPRSAASWTAKAYRLGRANPATRTDLTVYLSPRGGTAALQAAVAKVSDPKSSSYRQFLSAAAYHATYDPTDASVRQVSNWLRSNHLTVTSVEAHHRYLRVAGSVKATEKAFGVTLDTYRHNGQTVRASARAATVPGSVAALISGVSGLDSTPHKITHTDQPSEPPSPGFRNGRPCSAYYGQLSAKLQADLKTPLPTFKGKRLSYAVCGYTGAQLRAAYEQDSDLTGRGVTVAVTDAYASPTIRKDIILYAKNHGDAKWGIGQYTQVVPASFNRQSDCGPQGWYGEQTLDIEAVHAMANGANVRYYASASCYDDDFLDTLAQVVDENIASVVSNSWADLEEAESIDNVVAYEQVFAQGALQGIAFLYSSGDNGDETASTGIKQVEYPASDPYVTAVGGTADAIGADGSFLFQTGWGTHRWSLNSNGQGWTDTGYLYGAGGGSSKIFNRPSYQDGVVPARFGAGRTVPDVGLLADPNTGFLVGQTQTFADGAYYSEYRIGGTSLAAPLFAGMASLVNQHVGGRVGFLNPTLYAQATSGVFTDVAGSPPEAGTVRSDFVNGVDAKDGLRYSVRTFDEDSSLNTVRGWDNVTGLGVPKAAWLTSIGR